VATRDHNTSIATLVNNEDRKNQMEIHEGKHNNNMEMEKFIYKTNLNQYQQQPDDRSTGENEDMCKSVIEYAKIEDMINPTEHEERGEKEVEGGSSLGVSANKDEETDLLLMKELAEAEYHIPLQIDTGDMLEGHYPSISDATQKLLTITAAESKTLVNRGLKSPPMERLHALVSHQAQEERPQIIQGDKDNSSLQEDKEEVNSDMNEEEVTRATSLSTQAVSKSKKAKRKREADLKPTRIQAKRVEKICSK